MDPRHDRESDPLRAGAFAHSFWKFLPLVVLGVAVLAPLTSVPVLAQCVIEGVANVDEDQNFTLCGPRSANYQYRWSGPGITEANSRCVTVAGRSAGLYEYTLTLYSRGAELDQCTFVVTAEGAGGSASGQDVCDIVGPTTINAGETVELCGVPTQLDIRSYSWTGPGGFQANTRCVRVTGAGIYQLTTRNSVTGHARQCTHRLVSSNDQTQPCTIRGADVIHTGERVRLCGPGTGLYTALWSGPGGFSSTAPCVDVTRAGTYTLTLRHRSTGQTVRCTHTLDVEDQGGPDDSNDVEYDNCPRTSAWWSRAITDRSEVSIAELRNVARCVDERSQAFSWSDDVAGLRSALNPASPVTRRARAAQQLAALLANVCAREQGITAANGQTIGLDADTPVSIRSVSTVGELTALLDRMLTRRTGSFAQINANVTAVNRGQGIGATCQ